MPLYLDQDKNPTHREVKQRFQDIIRDPFNGGVMTFDAVEQAFSHPASGRTYHMEEGVPVFLTSKTERHTEDMDYATHYQKDGEVFDYTEEHHSAMTQFEIAMLRKTLLLKIPEAANMILDVGCGNAWVAKQLVPEGRNVISMDIGKSNPIKALRALPGPNHFPVVADVYHMPFEENAFDCVIASEVLEHVVDPKRCVEHLVRVTKPGGKVLISTPFDEKIVYHLCIHCNRPTPANAHLHTFDLTNIRNILPKSGSHFKAMILCNKGLLRLRTHLLFKHLPYAVWVWADRWANHLAPKAERLVMEIWKD